MMDKCVQMLDKNYGTFGQTALETREEPFPGSRELERRALYGENEEESLGSREREESHKGRRTDIGVKRKERR
ncbi:hypothetical protein TNCV_1623911 [Trichonephila clavipes]|nr:hypothetical protein TNCV_1623911 [Trichonephila clavipes]